MKSQIPREFIQQLLERIELVDLIDARVSLRKKTGSNYFACCPFHAEKSPSFSVSQKKQFYYCFGCGAHGNAIDFLMQYDRLDFREAIETLARQAGMDIPTEIRSSEKIPEAKNWHELLENITKFYLAQLRNHPEAIEYLKKRGLSGEICKQFSIGYAPPGWEHVLQAFGKTPDARHQLLETGMLIKKEDGGCYDRFRERIMFPIHDKRGRVIGFGGRILEKGEPKYLNSPETPLFQKNHELYGLYQALECNRQLKRVLIVEGYMDVIALFQHEITYAVATLGTATSANHLQRLFRHTADIIFCFDGDNAGRTAAWRALLVTLPVMKDGVQVKFMFLPEGEDPDSLVRKEGKTSFEQRMTEASTIADFFFRQLSEQTDVRSTDGRARFVKLATEHLDQLPSGIFQQMMFEELAKRARTTLKQLKPTAKSTFRRSVVQKAKPPSTLRLVLTLLIQHPSLVEQLQEPLPSLDMKGYDLLREMIEFLQQHPGLNTGTLLEHWRGTDNGKLLAKLAQFDPVIPETGLEKEFRGAIQQLRKLHQKQLIEGMLAKASQIGLSQEEKQQLHELISEKSE